MKEIERDLDELLWVLPQLRGSAIKRRDLCEKLNWHDAYLRKVFRFGREQGNMICANTDTGGYYVGTSENYGEGLQVDLQDLMGE